MANPITIDNVKYPTYAEAQRQTGINECVIRRFVKEGRAHLLNDYNGGRKWIVIGKRRYRTWNEAAEDMGYSRQWLQHCKRAGTLADLKPRRKRQ